MMCRTRSIARCLAGFTAFVLAITFAPPGIAASYHVILSGSGGQEEYQDQFRDWSSRLQTALAAIPEIDESRVFLLAEQLPDEPPIGKEIDLETIQAIFDSLSTKVSSTDDLYVYLIGHGAYIKDRSEFHIPGPDLSAEELGTLLDHVSARRVIILNSTSSSAGWINELSGPDRVICTATKSVTEVNAPRFMEYFIQSIEEGSADQDHDGRVSFLEACQQAAELTATWYMGEGLVATEHAILDDNGDGLGSRLPLVQMTETSLQDPETEPSNDNAVHLFDGSIASTCYLQDFSFGPEVPQELIDNYLAALDAVERLKTQKGDLDTDAYYSELEQLLIKAARFNQQIHSMSSDPADNS